MIKKCKKYSDEIVLIPTYMVLMSCPVCESRNIRTFPNVHFMDDDFPEKETNFISFQAQCKDCGKFIVASPRQYPIDTHGRNPKTGHEKGNCYFAGTLVYVGGEEEPDPKPKPKQKPKPKPKRKKSKKKMVPPEDDTFVNESKVTVIESEYKDGVWYPYPCDVEGCEEEFTSAIALRKHKKEEHGIEKRKPRKILEIEPIKYTESNETLVTLVAEYGAPSPLCAIDLKEGAFKKRIEICPHCDFEMKEWNNKDTVKEIMLFIDYDFGPIVSPEGSVVVVYKCPNCEKRSIGHEYLHSLLNYDFIDKDIIQKEMDKRGFVDGYLPDDGLDGDRNMQRAQRRMVEAKASMDFMMSGQEMPTDIPEFSVPCEGIIYEVGENGMHTGNISKCDVVLTRENSNPEWKTHDIAYLVVRCPKCHCQKPINDELERLGLL